MSGFTCAEFNGCRVQRVPKFVVWSPSNNSARALSTCTSCGGTFFQAEDGIRDVERSRGLGDVYKRQNIFFSRTTGPISTKFGM